jgi:hypothetical protein
MENQQGMSGADSFVDSGNSPATQPCQVYTFDELAHLESRAEGGGPNEIARLLLAAIVSGVAKLESLPIPSGVSVPEQETRDCSSVPELQRRQANNLPLIVMGPTVGVVRIGIDLTTFAPIAECTRCGERSVPDLSSGRVYLQHHEACPLVLGQRPEGEAA